VLFRSNALVDSMPTSANIVQYAKMVREKSLLRRLMLAATQIVEKGYEVDVDVEDYMDVAEQAIFQIAERKFRPSFYPIKDLVMENVKTIERLCEKKQAVTGVATGYVEIDRMTGGLQPSDLIIVAGRPSMGKTSFCLNIALNVAINNGVSTPVGIFSLEMSKEQLVMRFLSSEVRWSSPSFGAAW
jgi:replicative DNA helicase